MAEQQRVAQYVSECVAKAVNVVLSARAATGSGSLVREGRRSWVRTCLVGFHSMLHMTHSNLMRGCCAV